MLRKGITRSFVDKADIEVLYAPGQNGKARVISAAKVGKQSLYADPADVLNRETEDGFDLLKEMNDRQGYNLLWVRCRAIDADTVNANGDYFSAEELLQEVIHKGKKVPAYKTFEGCPIHTNHDNKDIQKAKGEVVYAEWDDKEQCVWCTFYISEDAYPEIANGVRIGMISDVSMGCTVESGVCSVCNHEAVKVSDYCEHLKNYKGKRMPGGGQKVYEKNRGIKFIELSLVNDGAFDSASITELYDQDELTQRALEFNRRVSSIRQRVLVADSLVEQFKPGAKREYAHMLRTAVQTTQTAVRCAQVQGTNPQLLAIPGANANSTVGGILKALGMDVRQQLNVLDLLNVALNFLEVAIMQMFTRKDNVDLQHVSKIAKAMSDLQGTMQDLIDDGVDSPVGAQAGQNSGGTLMNTPGAPSPAAGQTQPPGPMGDYSQAGGVGQMMNPIKASETSFTTEKPLNPLLGPNEHQKASLVWADRNSDGTREVYAAANRDGNNNLEKFGQCLMALAESVGGDTLATAAGTRAATNEQPVKHAERAREKSGGTAKMSLFKRIASKLRERTANAVSFDAKFEDPEGQHRVVISTSGDVTGFYMNRKATWQPTLNDEIITAMENEQVEYVGPALLMDLQNHVRSAQSRGIDVWSDLDLDPEGETDVKENALERERHPVKGDGDTVDNYVSTKRKDPACDKIIEETLEPERKGTDDKVKEELLEDAGLYSRREDGTKAHDFLVDDARCGCPDEHIELRLQKYRGRNDKVETRKLAFNLATELGKAAYSARVTPEEILEVAKSVASLNDVENLVAIAALGSETRERTAQRHAFYNDAAPLVGAENAVYHALGRIVSEDMKAGDVVDGLKAIVAAGESANKAVARVTKAMVANAPVEAAEVSRIASREQQFKAAFSSMGAEGEASEAGRGDLRSALYALAGAASECGATPEEVVSVLAEKDEVEIHASMELERTAEARDARELRRKREDFYGKRFASKQDVAQTVYGWLADFVQDGEMDGFVLAEATALLGKRPVAAANLVQKLMEREAAIAVTDEKCTTKRLTATVDDFGDLDPKANDFDQQFRQRAMDIFRQAGYDVDEGTFNLTNLSVDQSGNIQAEVSARLTKTFTVDGHSAPTVMGSEPVEATENAPMEDNSGNLFTVSAMDALGMERTAQAAPGGGAMGTPPGAMAGGAGPDPLAGAVDPMGGGFSAMTVPSEGGAPGTAPVEGEGDPDAMPEPGTKKPWGTICPVCGSSSVSIANGEGECQTCGTQLKFKLLVEAVPDEKDDGGGEDVMDEMPPEPGAEGADAGAMGAEMPPAPGAAPGGPAAPMMMQASWESSPFVWQRFASAGQGVSAEQAKANRMAMNQLPVGHVCPGCGSREAVEKIRNKTICTGCGTVAVSSIDTVFGKPNRLASTITWVLD
ncbi:MAG: hypothetical protein JSS66_05145 [Armatimonadetes bacterium]|nr:hypothetical protein [Armatimonadota bacterium]